MNSLVPASPSPDAGLCVPVKVGERSYNVRVVTGQTEALGPFARAGLDATWAGRTCRRALLVTDENVAPLAPPYAQALAQAGLEINQAVVPAGEASKSLEHAGDLYDELVKMRADRHTCVVALGGGVIGDLAGFVAATYARGVPLLMVPTTLLAQVDSAVGGKVAVNHPRAKNIIGAFYQPIGVWADTAALATLPPRELRCGLAEVIKYGVILDAELLAFLEQNTAAILRLEPGPILQVVGRSCELKADVVRRDEREETGLRAVLNFGHTIGHAIETVAGYGGPFQHGEAVAVGMVAACRLAERCGCLAPENTARLTALVQAFGLPTSAPGLEPADLLDAMTRDKKSNLGRIRFVLPRRLGEVELADATPEADIREVVEFLCRNR